MEQTLRCNNQVGGYCRAPLTTDAIVTTCSHIFCIDCARKTQFADAPGAQRACPVCQTALPNRDDVVHTRLSPSEDYKTSLMSGLDPATILDCAGRALAFWAYQTTQEIYYQEHVNKSLKDKYGQLSTAMDTIINEANAEISTLQNKVSNLSVDQRTLQDKYDELANLYRDKSKKAAQAQQLYDTLKKKFLMRSVATAASENVTQTLQSMANPRPGTYQEPLPEEALFSRGGIMQHARGDYEQPDLLGNDLRPVHHSSRRSSDSGRFADGMPPPPRPVATRISNPLAGGTPQQRIVLPAHGRATANRSQIPISTVRQDGRTHNMNQNFGSAIRHNATADNNTRSSGTPRGHGILGGMKVGRAGYAGGDSAAGPRFVRPEGML